ncbi:MAG TPA: putative lipid II flippase FtsW [Kaistiaceae bacterium]|nr:putative lipid II flippase FtsW [Kaistiaceae bacterium]
MVSRADRSAFAEWWWTVDRLLVAALAVLLVGGIVLSFAASPPVAERIGLEPYYFVKRQAMYLVPALGILIVTSFLTPRQVRRVALVVFVVSLLLMALTLVVGVEIKGARRWIDFGVMSLQPSEFAKPAFVVIAAWLFAESIDKRDVPGNILSVALLVLFAALLIAQPDFGQTMLVTIVWGAMFFMAGLPWPWIFALAGAGAGGIFTAYLLIPHVAGRIDRFLKPGTGDTFQVDTAIESILKGGWFGRGPGEGTVKRILPDSHTDFIFAVAAEEFGIIVCLFLVFLFAIIVLRGLMHAHQEDNTFIRLATGGLAVLFGIQAAINMAVNLQLMPAKGMTLPFISYGGSSLMSIAFGMGMLLALTRRRLRTDRLVGGKVPGPRGLVGSLE